MFGHSSATSAFTLGTTTPGRRMSVWIGCALLLLGLCCFTVADDVSPDDPPVLDAAYMEKVQVAVDLSLFAYLSATTPPNELEEANQYDAVTYYNDEPDQAMLVRTMGSCYVSFRGTTARSVRDIFQNSFVVGHRDVCPLSLLESNDDKDADCCSTRKGFWFGYDTNYRTQLEADIQDCVLDYCDDPDHECLYLTGHSQGGSIAHVAAVVLQQYHPYTITFGNDVTLREDDCSRRVQLDTTRMVRFVNTRVGWSWRGRTLQYDQISFAKPRPANNFGYTMILTQDVTGVASLEGLDTQTMLSPVDPLSLFRSHRIEPEEFGYRARIEALIEEGAYPIRTNGYEEGFWCTSDLECVSGNCRRRRCGSQ